VKKIAYNPYNPRDRMMAKLATDADKALKKDIRLQELQQEYGFKIVGAFFDDVPEDIIVDGVCFTFCIYKGCNYIDYGRYDFSWTKYAGKKWVGAASGVFDTPFYIPFLNYLVEPWATPKKIVENFPIDMIVDRHVPDGRK